MAMLLIILLKLTLSDQDYYCSSMVIEERSLLILL